MTETITKQGIRTFELIVYINGFLEGEIKDWPPFVQDTIWGALEAKAQEVQLPLVIVRSRCDVDYADDEGKPNRYYIHCIASEIVVKDTRFDNEYAMKKAFDELVAKGEIPFNPMVN